MMFLGSMLLLLLLLTTMGQLRPAVHVDFLSTSTTVSTKSLGATWGVTHQAQARPSSLIPVKCAKVIYMKTTLAGPAGTAALAVLLALSHAAAAAAASRPAVTDGLRVGTIPRQLLTARRLLQTGNAATSPQGLQSTGPGTTGQAAMQPSCSNAKSPSTTVTGSQWTANLTGANNIEPNTTGVPAPLQGPASGTYLLSIDEGGQKASWALKLCDIQQYMASHLHVGSVSADYPPPLIPLEPYQQPSTPFLPPEQLPHLCPPRNIDGCTYEVQGSFTAADTVPLPGRPSDREVPAISNWADFLSALKAGKIYVNVHSVINPAGVIRGNLVPAGAAQSGAAGPLSGPSPTVGPSTSGTSSPQAGGNSGGPSGSGSGAAGGVPPGFPVSVDSSAPNAGASYASSSSGPGGTHTEQGTYTRGNANADANANANNGGN